MQSPKAILVVDLRELALIYELTEEAANDSSLHGSEQQVAEGLYEDCRALLGRDNSAGSRL